MSARIRSSLVLIDGEVWASSAAAVRAGIKVFAGRPRSQ
jgi:hypothetical protein